MTRGQGKGSVVYSVAKCDLEIRPHRELTSCGIFPSIK